VAGVLVKDKPGVVTLSPTEFDDEPTTQLFKNGTCYRGEPLTSARQIHVGDGALSSAYTWLARMR